MSDPLWNPRALPPVVDRQQAVDRLVSSRGDINRAISQAAAGSKPLNLRLAADVILLGGITIPASIPRFQLTGGNIWRLRIAETLEYVFRILRADADVLLQDVAIAPTSTAFGAASFLTNVGTHAGLRMRGVSVDGCTELLDPLVGWSDGSVIDCSLGADTAYPAMSLRNGPSGINRYDVVSTRGRLSVTLTSGAGPTRFVDVNTFPATGTAMDTTGSVFAGFHTFIGCAFASAAPRAQDYVLASQFAGSNQLVTATAITLTAGTLNATTATVTTLSATTLTAATGTVDVLATPGVNVAAFSTANPTMAVTASLMRCSVFSGASGNLTLGDGTIDGQLLRIHVVAVLIGTLTLPNSTANNVRLPGGAFSFVQGKMLSLIWHASDSNWIEAGRT